MTGLGALWLPFWWFLFRDDPRESRRVNQAELLHIHAGGEAVPSTAVRRSTSKAEWKLLLTNRTLLANHWAFAALLLWSFGYLSDYLLKRTGRLRIARSLLIAGSQLVAALAVLPVGFVGDLWLAIACITVAVGFSMGANAAYYAVNVDVMPDRAATVLGVMDTAFAIAGFLAPAITGWVIGLRGSFADAFLLLFVLALSSVAVVLLFHHLDRDRPAAALAENKIALPVSEGR